MIVRGPVFANINLGKKSWRIVAIGNTEINLYIGMDLEAFQMEINRFRNAFLVGMPVALILLAFGGWLIAHRALRPVNVIAATTANVTTKGLNLRIPRTDADREFAGLIDVINGMLDRLEKSFQQAMRFSGDAAHELKTPLTILQGQLEQALQEAPAGSEIQQKYGELLEEVRRLSSITKKLLLLSQADSGQMKLSLAPFGLSSALESMADDVAILAPDLKLEKDIRPGANIMADKDLINQALQNLVTNAIKYNKKGGWIKFDLYVEWQTVVFKISNSGEEIPGPDRDKIFDRFYRVDKSRNREVDGIGLGLSLAREIVLAHKGELSLASSINGVTTFVMKLPVILS
jgi:two-component system, OmpR family, heavy metal sensor histidine kinase CusS